MFQKNSLYKMIFCLFVAVSILSCNTKDGKNNTVKKQHQITSLDSVKLKEYLEKSGRVPLFSKERQQYLDSVLQIDPENAYYWQQKAMPLYKARKYSLGKPFLAKAVLYNPEKYLDYSAFMKCIFSKEYEESIKEFLECKERFGDSYVMDHTYNFYIALNYLQLNKFKEAKVFLLKSKAQQVSDFPKDLPEEAFHFLDWFYLGIADYELGNYKEAITSFDMSLKVQTSFADAMWYEAICLMNIGEKEAAKALIIEMQNNKESSIMEANSYYEIYPYQIYHKLHTAH